MIFVKGENMVSFMMLNPTFKNISFILWRSVSLVEESVVI